MEDNKNDAFEKCDEFFNSKNDKDNSNGLVGDIPCDKDPDIITENDKYSQTTKTQGTPDGCNGFFTPWKKKKKLVPTPSGKDDWFYNMNHKNRGIAIILNHEIFENKFLKFRSGTHTDCTNLERVLKNFGFEVKIYTNPDLKKIDKIIDEFSSIDHSDYDCFLMAVLSYGQEGKIYANDKTYKPDRLMDSFRPDKCPTLAGKPKLYLIQACQADKLDTGPEVGRTQVDGAFRSMYRIPLHADFLIAYSTVPGFYSWHNSHKGSWFMQALCEQLEKYGAKLDLMIILTFVNGCIAVDFKSNAPDNMINQQKQIPCVTSMLTRILKFSKK